MLQQQTKKKYVRKEGSVADRSKTTIHERKLNAQKEKKMYQAVTAVRLALSGRFSVLLLLLPSAVISTKTKKKFIFD